MNLVAGLFDAYPLIAGLFDAYPKASSTKMIAGLFDAYSLLKIGTYKPSSVVGASASKSFFFVECLIVGPDIHHYVCIDHLNIHNQGENTGKYGFWQ